MLRCTTISEHYVTDTVAPDNENTEIVYNKIMKKFVKQP